MGFHPIAVDSFDVGYTVLSGFVVIFGLFSLFLKERLYVGEAVWATVFGIIIGPHVSGIFDPRGWGSDDQAGSNEITVQVTRIVLAVGVFAIGVELPKAYVGRHWKSLAFLLAPVMVFGWFISSAIIFALVPKINYLSSLAIAACLTPTDPILAAAVVGGRYAEKHVPAHLRHLLAAESGVNDGAAFPMLFIALYLILDDTDGAAVGHWFYITWVYEIILGTFLGALLGWAARHTMKYCERHDLIDRHSYVAQYISLALLSNGVTTILGSDDLLSSFACGTAFAYDGWFNKKTEETLFSNVIDLIFNCACFIYIGAWLPFSEYNNDALSLSWWRLLIISILVILFRRIPIMLALYNWIPEVKTFREAVFSGHFGPMGVGAVFISTLAIQNIPAFDQTEAGRPPETQIELLAASMQPIVSYIVLVSIAIHGLSIPFFSLGKRVHSISRTWSRRSSMDPTASTPEWATQTHRVQRGDEIIINRDPGDVIPEGILEKMERGEIHGSPDQSTPSSEISMDEKRRLDIERQAAVARGDEVEGVTERSNSLERQHGGEGHALEEERLDRTRSSGSGSGEGTSKRAPEDRVAEKDSPIPDREQVAGDTTQWREGKDLIIERNTGEGDDVEVEVIRNAFDENETSMRKVVQGARDSIKAHYEAESKHAHHKMEDLARHVSPTTGHAHKGKNADGDTDHDDHHEHHRVGTSKMGLKVIQAWAPVAEGHMQNLRPEDVPEKRKTTTSFGAGSKPSASRPAPPPPESRNRDADRQNSGSTMSDPEQSADVEDNRGEGTSRAPAPPRLVLSPSSSHSGGKGSGTPMYRTRSEGAGLAADSGRHGGHGRSRSTSRSLRFADEEDGSSGVRSPPTVTFSNQPSPSQSQPPSPTKKRGRRRHSFRRRLFGRSRFAPQSSGNESDQGGLTAGAAAALSDQESGGEEEADVENEDDGSGDDDEGEGDETEAEGEGGRRGRSKSPIPLKLNHPRHHRGDVEGKRVLDSVASSRSPSRSAASTPRRRTARFTVDRPQPESRDEVDDPGELSSAPSPQALQQRLDNLAAAEGNRPGLSPLGSRPNSSYASNRPSRLNSQSNTLTSSTLTASGSSNNTNSNTRSIRFAEDAPFGHGRTSSSTSISRLARTSSQGQIHGSGSGHSHLHYQHGDFRHARTGSPGPSGGTTPRFRAAPIGAPISANDRTVSEQEDEQGHVPDEAPGRAKKPKVPLSELF